MTGQRGRIGESVVGSPLDRLLSQYLGQPLTLAMVLTHKKPGAPRVDVLSDHSRVGPEDKLQRRDKIGGNAGYVYADDADFTQRVKGNAALMKRLKDVSGEITSDAERLSRFLDKFRR